MYLNIPKALKCHEGNRSTYLTLFNSFSNIFKDRLQQTILKLPLEAIFFKLSFEKWWSKLESLFYQISSLFYSTFLLTKYILELIFLLLLFLFVCLSCKSYSKINFVVSYYYYSVEEPPSS